MLPEPEVSAIYFLNVFLNNKLAQGITIGLDLASALFAIVIVVALFSERKAGLIESKYIRWILEAGIVMTVSNVAIRTIWQIPQKIVLCKVLLCVSMAASFAYSFLFLVYLVYNLNQRAYVHPELVYSAAFVSAGMSLVWIIGIYQNPSWFVEFDKVAGTFEYKNSFILPLFVYIVLNLFSAGLVLSCAKFFPKKNIAAWLAACEAPMILTGIILILTGEIISSPFILGIFIVYSNVHIHKLNEASVTEKNLSESKAKLLVSQIQPHFLYNSLNSIYYLIGKDPDQAKEALSIFSDYLRGNVNSLKNDNPVPFTEELEHVNAYLNLERMRFGDRIKIIYNVEENDFLLPPLSVQPLVENSIKHGLSKKAEGGHVWISTYKDEDNYYVEIKDDGVGFDAGSFKDDSSTHIGLFNVNSRLSTMCNGKLSVTSTIGQGTISKIILPKEVQSKQKKNLL